MMGARCIVTLGQLPHENEMIWSQRSGSACDGPLKRCHNLYLILHYLQIYLLLFSYFSFTL